MSAFIHKHHAHSDGTIESQTQPLKAPEVEASGAVGALLFLAILLAVLFDRAR
jgi:hypothetical protein